MSKIQLSPYVNFQGRAREAMDFYQRALGGSVDIQTGQEDRVAYARLEADGALIVGSDGHPKFPTTAGDNMAIALNGADRARLSRAFNALAEGGQLKGPLTKQPSGAEVGYLMDKFGINWIVTIDPT